MGKAKRGLKIAAVIAGSVVLLLIVMGGIKATMSREGAINRKKAEKEWDVTECPDVLFQFSCNDESMASRTIIGTSARILRDTPWFYIELMRYRYEADEQKRSADIVGNYADYMTTDKDTVKRILNILRG